MSKQYTPAQKRAYAAKFKNGKKSTAGKPRVKKTVRKHARGKFHVSHCAQEYVHSLCLPFDAPPSCIPSSFPLPSSKQKFKIRGEFSLGTTGYGYIIFRPNIANDPGAGDMLISTTDASVGGVGVALNAFTNLTNTRNYNSPYNNATDINTGFVQSRCVSAGLRIRFTGREDSMNGTITMFEEPDHLNLDTQTMDYITNRDQALRLQPRDGWAQINYSGPITPNDIEYGNTSTPLGTNYFMCILVKGAPGDAYEFESVINVETIGSIVHGRSPSHADEQAYGQILATVKGKTANSVLTPEAAPSIFNQFVNTAIEAAPSIMSAGKQLMGVMELDPGSILRTALGAITSQNQAGNRLMGTGDQGFRGFGRGIFG